MNPLQYPLLLLTVILTACMPSVLEQATATSDGNQASLSNTEWSLESFGEPGMESPVIDGSTITLKFDGNGQVAGQSGCNSYGGPYIIQSGALRFREVISTLVACEDQVVNDQEQEYLNALRTAGRFNMSDDRLVIWYENDRRVLNFTRASDIAPAPLPINNLEPTVGDLPGSIAPPSQERVVFESGAISATRR